MRVREHASQLTTTQIIPWTWQADGPQNTPTPSAPTSGHIPYGNAPVVPGLNGVIFSLTS
jgi:hypothetical protein